MTLSADESPAALKSRLSKIETAYTKLEKDTAARIRSMETECIRSRQKDEALELARVIIDNSPVVLFQRLAGDNPRLVYVSDNIRQFGYEPSDFIEERILFRDILHPDDRDRVGDEIDSFIEKGMETYRQNYRILTPAGDTRWIEDRTSVVRDDGGNKTHHQGILVDITERTLTEKALARSEEKYRRIIETTGQGFVMMDEHLTILDVNEAYCRMLGYSRQELIGRSPLDLATPDFRRFLDSNRRHLLASDEREFEGSLVAKSGRIVPVLIHGNTLKDDGGHPLGNIAFVTDLTQQKQSLLLAAEVQRHLLPQTGPCLNGLEVAGRSLPCDEIGGDYFDFITRGEGGNGPVCLVVGDITGHGVDAALFMTASRSFLRLRASQPGSSTQIISDMNRHLSSDANMASRFMTLFFMVVEPEQHRIRWVRAGHDPALIYSPEDDRFHELKGSGIALGLDPNYPYEENSYHDLTTGQIITVGTDGIWEARNPDGEMFGKDRLCRIIRDSQDESADTILNRVYDALYHFQDGSRSEDDMTLVIAKATPPAIP